MEQKCGTEFWRPGLFAMLTAVQQGRVNAVMVQSLDRLSHDLTTLYRILRFLQNHGAVLITTETNLQYELYLTGLESRLLKKSLHIDGHTCIISYVTISMFKIGFSQKGWTFSPRVVPDFFQARLFLFWAISDFGGFAVGRNTSALTQ